VIREGSSEYKRLRDTIVPPYDPGKFPNKWRKMWRDQPARTLMAHLGKDGYSHIHYDSEQARTISVREAARLQSFPDGFRFSGTMNPAFRQIGNAVPPLMALALAGQIMAALEKSNSRGEIEYVLSDATAAV
jgi:DNA (cytosine-5)-methyltransferase 1